MKVLFQSRKTLFSVPGGDTIQILKTKEYLGKLGVRIDISTELEPDLREYDLVHVFNLMRPQEVYLQIKNAKRQHKKVALSTIYGLYTEYERKGRGGIIQRFTKTLNPCQIEYLKVLARGIKNNEIHRGALNILTKGYFGSLKEIITMVDVLLPNSQSEMYRIRQDFDLNNPSYSIVPNAVDLQLFDYDKTQISDKVKKYIDCILCVSRIEGRKSQLNLVKALKGSPYHLVLIGKPAPNHIKYYNKVKQEAGNNVTFLDYIPHNKLPEYYKLAKVHALVSWMETPGLSSLEAGVMKCNVVATRKGDTEEYFGDYAFYCKPGDINSIREAITNAYDTPFSEKFRQYISENFTWSKAAVKTLEAYKKVIEF